MEFLNSSTSAQLAYATPYKINLKILADKIKPIFKKLISPTQATFMLDRWIGENVVVVNEVLHSMKRKKGFWGLLGIKIDMQNAYDIVNWVVLTRILTLFGFFEKCVKLILNCISSVSMELLLNGSVFGTISMERELRQGDPLSPFLFIIMMELLSRMLFKWERKKKFHGVKLGRMAPSISHSLFTDDLIIFCRANLEEVRNIKRCLQLYCKWSGQDFNKEKSGCFFSFNVELKIKAAIKICLGMKEVDKRAKHMGLPLTVGRSKTVAFEELKQ